MKKQDFCIFEKKDKKGRITVYYSVYDDEGKRHAYSTGTSDKIEAFKTCLKKLADGTLIPTKKQSFSDYARNFYKYGESNYLKEKEARGFTLSLANLQKKNNFINKQAIPFFKNKNINLLSYRDIEDFLEYEKKLGKSNSTINNYIKILNPIFIEAKKENFITVNPMNTIENFKNDTQEKGAFTASEVNFLFSKSNIKKIWNNNFEGYIFNKLAVKTGLRIGELQAICIEDLSDNTLLVKHSWTEGYGLVETKTRTTRKIPISNDLIIDLANYLGSRKTGFIFSHTDGKTPITRHQIYKTYKDALENAGFTREILEERHISFHSWRHTFASILANKGAPELFIRKLTGHQSSTVFHNYTHADIEEMKKYLF